MDSVTYMNWMKISQRKILEELVSAISNGKNANEQDRQESIPRPLLFYHRPAACRSNAFNSLYHVLKAGAIIWILIDNIYA